MSDATRPDDCIFQISAVAFRRGDLKKNCEKILITIGEPDRKIMEESNIKTITVDNERQLLNRFIDVIEDCNPQVIIGYNILGFDINYILTRLRYYDMRRFTIGIGCLHEVASQIEDINWSSSAYGSQEFKFIDAKGRLFIDLLPIVKRTYKLNTYKLGVVAEKFLGHTKDPLKPSGIFKCYRIGIKNKSTRGTPKGKQALAICGKYCVQDAFVTAELFSVMNIWVGLCEEASVLNVPISYLFLKGQQIRMFSQIYKLSLDRNMLVQENVMQGSSTKYAGAIVLDPIPGVYHNVVPFDFTSLYPTAMVSNNISYDTLVHPKNDKVDDKDCHIVEWSDHINCEHDLIKKDKKVATVCKKYKFKWYKHKQGIVCHLLDSLLSQRQSIKKQIKKLKKKLNDKQTPNSELEKIKTMLIILDKRQWSFKISANSVYGAMGATKGYLPFLPGAMCTTACGRKYLTRAVKLMKDTYNANIIYGDTDSTMVIFPDIKTTQELWDHCIKIEEELVKFFPSPMQLAFERKIYKVFFILSKKRYATKVCYRDGVPESELSSKGILLSRRDNSLFTRNFYGKIINHIMDGASLLFTQNIILELIEELFTRKDVSIKQYIITQSVNSIDKYKTKHLPVNDEKEVKRLFALKKCSDPETYKIRCLPAHVQLAIEMRKCRGQRVDPGTRLEYVSTTRGGPKGKKWEKIEDPNYMGKYHNIYKISPLFYLETLVVSVDQLLSTAFKTNHFMLTLHKLHIQKNLINSEIKRLFTPIELE
jgi:DNA polymerase elongation subunit (family B)